MTSVCWQITFSPKEAPSETFCNFLDDFFEVNAQNYTDNDYDEYIGYQSGHFDEREMLVQAAKREIILPPYKIEKLTSENWLKDYVIKFDPFEVADFCIYGIHETTPPQTTKIPLQIYAATAFGSNHQTTQSCIRALCELYYDGFKPQCILDIGTGSGILCCTKGGGIMTDLVNLKISEALDLLNKGEISSEDLTRAHIEEMGKARVLNAFITETPEIALAQAKESDARRKSGKIGALEGIPGSHAPDHQRCASDR